MTSKTFHLHISYSNNLGFILDNVKGIQASEKQFKIFDYIKSLWFLMDFYYYRNTLLCRWSKTKIISIVATGYYGNSYLELPRLKTHKADAKVQYQSILLNKSMSKRHIFWKSKQCLTKVLFRHLKKTFQRHLRSVYKTVLRQLTKTFWRYLTSSCFANLIYSWANYSLDNLSANFLGLIFNTNQ